MRTKLKSTLLIILPDSTNVIKSYEMTLNSIRRNQNTETRKPSFTKEEIENTDLHEPVLRKIMTTHK